jgi:NADPH:quinone reductase-like Zn-dependent oxidoreductase
MLYFFLSFLSRREYVYYASINHFLFFLRLFRFLHRAFVIIYAWLTLLFIVVYHFAVRNFSCRFFSALSIPFGSFALSLQSKHVSCCLFSFRKNEYSFDKKRLVSNCLNRLTFLYLIIKHTTNMARRLYAAVVKALGQAPIYELIDLSPPTADEVQVQVIAAGAHRIVRSIASGNHYIKPKILPFVPGIDGVGTLSNGKKVYFVTMTPPNGSMSECVNILPKMTVPLPDAADPVIFAAIMNAGLASWMALRERARIQPGDTVLILGVTGSSGQMAATSARLLGAKRVIGVGRNTSMLDQLLASGSIDTSIPLDNDDARFEQAIQKDAADVDIVMDFLWGRPTEIAMAGIQSARKDATQRLRWVEIGQMAGATIQCSAALLRSKNIEISGSGIGPVSMKDMLKSMEDMVPMVMDGKLTTSVLTIPLKDIEKKWEETADAKERVVVVM